MNLNFIENAILNWNELMELDTNDVETEYERRLKLIVPNECCTIMYTSGTTGFPKGVMLSHDSLIWDIKKSCQVMNYADAGNDTFISYLPLSHLTAFAVDIFIAINTGGTVYFTDIKSVVQCLKEIQPTFFVAVPRIYEKIQEKLSEKINEFNLIKRKILSWSQNVISENYFTPNSSSLKCKLANYFVINRIKEALGLQKCKFLFTGSAPMSNETKIFFISLSMPIYEAYGMTESSTVHCLTSHQTQIHSLESVGICLDGTETKIIEMDENGDGEICMRGRHVFMGYLNDIQQTIETIDDDGWLHTGDIGRIDENGLIYLTGRKKEMIITSGGENIPKTRIENLVKLECPAISNAFLVGDKRKFLTILLTLKTEIDENFKPKDELTPETQKWLDQNSLKYSKLSDILSSKDVKILKAFQNVIDRVNIQALSNPQRIQKFAILPNDFTVVTGELTPTLKVKRHFVLEKYRKIIDEFYL
ncbi:very long-chain-fatty-acid--CoA ligase bubblegum-like [Chironomus tepperi]|uniref:very long-chain-fatty-acid--CoA ligase bubblegum-like n=1 Tax=Chironomus tepperi TaxID=113505 RepID=UPI00391EE4AF